MKPNPARGSFIDHLNALKYYIAVIYGVSMVTGIIIGIQIAKQGWV